VNLEIVEFSGISLISAFIIRDYLSKDELEKITKVIREKTEKDAMNKKTNVQAIMTDWDELKNPDLCGNVLEKIALTLDAIIKLRGRNTKDTHKYNFLNVWGMRHQLGDYTYEHNHLTTNWSGAFYASVPEPKPIMRFVEFNSQIELESNMLVLFPGMILHEVLKNMSQEDRLSMAFNINLEKHSKM